MTANSVIHNKKFLAQYKAKTRKNFEGKSTLNPVAGKYLFARIETNFRHHESRLLQSVWKQWEDFDTNVISLFMFSELDYLAQKVASPDYLFYLERGDFEFIESLVQGLNSRKADEVEEFCEAVFFNNTSVDFVKPFSLISKNIRALKYKYLQRSLDN